MTLDTLTAMSTTFIVLSGLSVLLGWYFIRWLKNMTLHRNAMLTATTFAGLFLISYVVRWSLYGSQPFPGEGGWRIFFFVNLALHIVLAIAVGPLALRLIYLALKKRDFRAHRKLGRITLPIWLYVAASGWLIYFLLHKASF